MLVRWKTSTVNRASSLLLDDENLAACSYTRVYNENSPRVGSGSERFDEFRGGIFRNSQSGIISQLLTAYARRCRCHGSHGIRATRDSSLIAAISFARLLVAREKRSVRLPLLPPYKEFFLRLSSLVARKIGEHRRRGRAVSKPP